MNAESKLIATRNLLDSWQADGVLISNPSNIRWLSGFSGSAGYLIITHEKAILATDSRYWEQASGQSPDFELFKDQRRLQDTVELLQSFVNQRIVIEANDLTVSRMQDLETVASISWMPKETTLEPLREIKSLEEVRMIKSAAAITDMAMDCVPGLLKPGLKEKGLAWELEKRMRAAGADSLAFPTIVAFGPNSARPHHEPGEKELGIGDIVLIDMGASISGYRSDLTRTYFYGDKPDAKFEEIFNVVETAQSAVLNKVLPGLDTRESFHLAYDIAQNSGYADYFGGGLGHGVGLDIHEAPFLSAVRPAVPLKSGTIFTCEPGIYIPGWGGIRIEDLAYLNKNGVELLSASAKISFIQA